MVRRMLTWVGKPWAFELRPGLNTFGRNPTNTFRLSDPSVSSFHAEVCLEGDTVKVRDLNSTNGTFIDGRLVEEGELELNGTLHFGSVELRMEVVVTHPPASDVKSEGKTNFFKLAGLRCAGHPEIAAAYLCASCEALHCQACVTVVGHDRVGTMTVCPACGGQCSPLPAKAPAPPAAAKEPGKTLMGRITQTLKIPWVK